MADEGGRAVDFFGELLLRKSAQLPVVGDFQSELQIF